LREKNEQYNELQIEHEKLKKEFEALKKKLELSQSQMAPAPVKSVLSIIDDSDDEDEGPTIKIKDHKIIKAIECECDFLD